MSKLNKQRRRLTWLETFIVSNLVWAVLQWTGLVSTQVKIPATQSRCAEATARLEQSNQDSNQQEALKKEVDRACQTDRNNKEGSPP